MAMQFKFKIQEYQTAAARAVTDVFEGQPNQGMSRYLRDLGRNVDARGRDTLFDAGTLMGLSDEGFANVPVRLSPEKLLSRIRGVQRDGQIMESPSLNHDIGAVCLDVEMETGTGKTYVYIKTMFELNRLYGWSKFIVVVPSIAIREGVAKTFQTTEQHFFECYGKRVRWFVYNSDRLNDLDAFSEDDGICCMVINMQAFNTSMKEGAKNKYARKIFEEQDSFQSRRPIDVIAANRPIVIQDEPQKMGGKATQDGIRRFNPLFCLSYSATILRDRSGAPIHNLVNEFYSRDTSKKVKAVKRACAESGKFMGTYPAYGYKRDPGDKHHLVIDEETAPTVRRIFAMRAAAMGFRAIAVTLNEEGVLPPGALYYQRKGRSDPRNVNHKWAETTVKALIRSEVYIGNMVQGKTGTLSYKSRKLINKPEEEWIRVEGTHEPIISREIWDTVVSIDKKKVRKTPPTDGIRSIFTGLVYCADCGFKMRNHIERFTYKDGTPGRYSSFICGNYARSGKSACTIHSIYENVLEELVLTDIREKARFVECDGERLAEQISRMKEKESRSRVISYEQELKAAAARMAELERLMQNLYEDKCTGTIPQTVFQTLMRKYETERAEKAAAIPELEQKVRAQLENRQDANRWMEVIRRYTEITALDESILFELVDRIEVGEARKVNGQRICDVKVVYRYVGSVDDALAQERLEAYEKAI